METRTAMSTSHRSKRKAVKDWFRKRMTRTTPALASAESLDDRLARVVSYREAIPLIDELLPSIQIGLDEPAFIIDWQPTNVAAFVFVANQMNPAQAPPWLRTRPGGMTPESFMDDVVNKVQPDVDRRRGWVFLAPNTMEQYGAILGRFIAIQNAPFLQDVAQAALPVINNVEPYLAVTYFLTESRAQRAQPVNLQPNCFNDAPMRQLFI